jgi:hypothetical protein
MHLAAHYERADERTGLAFGHSAIKPFSDSGLRSRAKQTWSDAGMLPIGFHEAQHTYACGREDPNLQGLSPTGS